MLVAVDEAGGDTFRLGQHIYPEAPLGHLLEQNGQLQFGHAGADAAVDAIAE